jgi:hypothetical protein
MHSPHHPATTPFRIQASEARLISIGLRSILKRHDLYRAGFLRSVSRIITVAERRFDRGEFTSGHFVIVTRAVDAVLNVAAIPQAQEDQRQMAVEALKQTWPGLCALERGQRLRVLLDQGCSQRWLSRQLGCSRRLIRQLIELAEASDEEKQALSLGERGRKKTLELGRRRRAEQKLSRLLENEESKEKLIEQHRQLIYDFIQGQVALCDRERFFLELHYWINVLRAVKPDAPVRRRCPAESPTAPWSVIERCKPDGPPPSLILEQLTFVLHWLLRWLPQVIPNREIMDAAFDRAERDLLDRGAPTTRAQQPEQNRFWSISQAALEDVDLLVALGPSAYLFGKALFAKYRRIFETQQN